MLQFCRIPKGRMYAAIRLQQMVLRSSAHHGRASQDGTDGHSRASMEAAKRAPRTCKSLARGEVLRGGENAARAQIGGVMVASDESAGAATGNDGGRVNFAGMVATCCYWQMNASK